MRKKKLMMAMLLASAMTMSVVACSKNSPKTE